MEIRGKIIFVGALRSGKSQRTGEPWYSQDYVIETEEQFPQRMVFSIFGKDKIDSCNVRVGEYRIVKVAFDAVESGSANERNWFNRIKAWSCVLDPTRVQPQTQACQPQQFTGYAQTQTQVGNDNNLPF